MTRPPLPASTNQHSASWSMQWSSQTVAALCFISTAINATYSENYEKCMQVCIKNRVIEIVFYWSCCVGKRDCAALECSRLVSSPILLPSRPGNFTQYALILRAIFVSLYVSDTVEPLYNEVFGTMKITLLYQVSRYIRVKN